MASKLIIDHSPKSTRHRADCSLIHSIVQFGSVGYLVLTNVSSLRTYKTHLIRDSCRKGSFGDATYFPFGLRSERLATRVPPSGVKMFRTAPKLGLSLTVTSSSRCCQGEARSKYVTRGSIGLCVVRQRLCVVEDAGDPERRRDVQNARPGAA